MQYPELITAELAELSAEEIAVQIGNNACAWSGIVQRTPDLVRAGFGDIVRRVADGNEDPRLVDQAGRAPSDVLHSMHFSGGLAASGPDGAFGICMFVRDYLTGVEDVMGQYPEVARAAFSIIPQQQGVKYDALTEEQPGRLPHQVVKGRVGGRALSADAMERYRHWAGVWGVPVDEDGSFTVYNASDGIRYLSVLKDYVALHGSDVLQDTFFHEPTGEKDRSVRKAARIILDWEMLVIENSEQSGGPGLFEVAATNPRQTSWSGVMRDGLDSYWHPEGPHGKHVNRIDPVAYINNQGLAISALLAGAELFPDDPMAEAWQHKAGELQRRTVEHFWLDSEEYWSAAVDRDEFGKPRPVKLIGNEPLELLATDFFRPLKNGLKERDAQDLLRMTALRAADPGLMTPVGPTMLHAKHSQLEGDNYCSYQGTRSVWPVAVRRIAAGYRKQGLDPIAHDIGFRRLLGGLQNAGCFPEYFFIDKESRQPNYAVLRRGPLPDSVPAVGAAELPVRNQMWTITAALAELEAERELRSLLTNSAYTHEWLDSRSWEAEVCAKYFAATQDLPPASMLPETAASKNGQPEFRIDTALGKELRGRLQRLRHT